MKPSKEEFTLYYSNNTRKDTAIHFGVSVGVVKNWIKEFKCGKDKSAIALTTEKFIIKAKCIHGEKYDYHKVDYRNSKIEVEIVCPVHGSFWQKPIVHNSHGCGCPKCGIITCGSARLVIPEEHHQKIIEDYRDQKVSPVLLAKQYNCSTEPIYGLLKKYDIPANTDRDYRDTLEDENFFEVIDTEQKAYLLGLLAADGCVQRSASIKNGNINKYSISLSLIDEDLVKQAAHIIGHKGKINFLPERLAVFKGNKHWCKPVWSFFIHSKKMVMHLISHGVGTTKSVELHMPKLTNNLASHFIRGFFDGDGCITFAYDSKNWENGRPIFSIIGLRDILKEIQAVLIKHCGVSHTELVREKRVKTTEMFNLRYSGEFAIAIRDYLYHDATIYLQRKHKRFYSVESPKDRRSGYTINEYCEQHGFNHKTVSQWINKGLITSDIECGMITIDRDSADAHAQFMKDTVSVQEAAEKLGIPLGMMYQFTHRNIISTCDAFGVRSRITQAEVERIINLGVEEVKKQYYRIKKVEYKQRQIGKIKWD